MSANRSSPEAGGCPWTSGSTASSLLVGLKQQDPEAWVRLTRLYGPWVYQKTRRAGLQADDAADVVQEVFRAVATGIGRFRHDRPDDSFRKWLATVARSKIQDFFRHHASEAHAQGGTAAQLRLAETPENSRESSVDDNVPADDRALERRAVEMVRARVGDRTWRAFWRVTVDGRSVAETAAELAMSRHAVYDANYRVRAMIHQEFRELIG